MVGWNDIARSDRNILLHVGCGHNSIPSLPSFDYKEKWQQVRVDIDPDVNPDLRCSIVDMAGVPDGVADCVFSKHNIEHVEAHEVQPTLRSFARVLKDTGFLIIRTPDLRAICRSVLEGDPERTLYVADWNGEQVPIAPLDMLYGSRHYLSRGNPFMAHRTAFTQESLTRHLKAAGFPSVLMEASNYELRGIACRQAGCDPKRVVGAHVLTRSDPVTG